jgi:hypothetical protein
VARAPTVPQQVDVQLELLARRGQREHLVVQLDERRARAQQVKARPHTRDVRVDRHFAAPEREQEHAGGGLAPDARQRDEDRAGTLERRRREPVERRLAALV